jgi:hypothetical protein
MRGSFTHTIQTLIQHATNGCIKLLTFDAFCELVLTSFAFTRYADPAETRSSKNEFGRETSIRIT